MLRINGELALLIDEIEFNSKQELLEHLRYLREDILKFEPSKRKVLKEMIGIAIQQTFRLSEHELLKYKKYIRKKEVHKKQCQQEV